MEVVVFLTALLVLALLIARAVNSYSVPGTASSYFMAPSRGEITRQAISQIYCIASEGRRAMDVESERFLREEYECHVAEIVSKHNGGNARNH
jgi:hypothetical protein